MNRRDRRALKGKREAGFSPGPTYLACVRRMAEELRGMVPAPRFRLPPREAAFISPIHALREELAGDEATARVIDRFCAIGCQIGGGPNYQPSLLMLEAALGMAGIPVERMPLEHFTHGQPLFPMTRGSTSQS
jgi:hypothetical protein